MAKKPSMGRQKIKIAKIEIKNHLQVTFSKRRSGLFKKASELCTLCGVEIAIVVFSPAEKFSPSATPTSNLSSTGFSRLRNLSHHQNSNTFHLVEAHRNASLRELNLQLTHILNQLETERKGGEALDNMRKASQSQCWWEAPIDNMSLHELEQLRDSMEELKKNVTSQASRILVENANTLSLFGGVDLFETKPTHITSSSIQTSHHVHNFGYGHGFF